MWFFAHADPLGYAEDAFDDLGEYVVRHRDHPHDDEGPEEGPEVGGIIPVPTTTATPNGRTSRVVVVNWTHFVLNKIFTEKNCLQ